MDSKTQLVKKLLFTPYELEEGDDGIMIGESLGWLMQEGFINFFDSWVREADEKMDKCEHTDTVLYQKLLGIRFVSFKEYQKLFKVVGGDTVFQKRAYCFFLLDNTERLKEFISTKEDNERGYIQSFVNWFKPVIGDENTFGFFFKKQKISLRIENLKPHGYIVGKSGTGKSEIMKLMMYGLMIYDKFRKSIVLIEPHGDLAREFKRLKICWQRKEDIIFFDAHLKAGYVPTINPFHVFSNDLNTINVLSSELVNAFEKIITEDAKLSGQMRTILVPCTHTLLRMGGKDLRDLQTFMDDEKNQAYVNEGMKSPIESHASFFKDGFYKKTFKTTKDSIYTRIQQLLNYPEFGKLVNGKSTINLEQAINSGKVILFSLAQGKLGEDASQSFGRLMLALVRAYTLRRAFEEKSNRTPVFTFIDEFQNYMGKDIKKILAESRKYGLHLILSHQIAKQDMTSSEYEAILGNTSTKIAGVTDGTETPGIMAERLGISKKELMELKKYQFYAKSGEGAAFKFFTPDFLIDPKKGFIMDKQEEKNIDNYFVQKGYYKPVESTVSNVFTPDTKPTSENNDESPTPMFGD